MRKFTFHLTVPYGDNQDDEKELLTDHIALLLHEIAYYAEHSVREIALHHDEGDVIQLRHGTYSWTREE